MTHQPWHQETEYEREARKRAERQAAMQEGGYGSGKFSRMLYDQMQGKDASKSFFSPKVGKTIQGLQNRGFSDREIKKLFADMDRDPDEYGIKDMKVFSNESELHRYVMAYVDESSQLYQQTLDTEREMKREEADARLQRDFDKAVAEATKPTEEEAGMVADRKRQEQKSKQYIQSKGGVSMQQARKGGAVMIPQRRPM
jgi:hypothetical protein